MSERNGLVGQDNLVDGTMVNGNMIETDGNISENVGTDTDTDVSHSGEDQTPIQVMCMPSVAAY
jgi:hypothetical protein